MAMLKIGKAWALLLACQRQQHHSHGRRKMEKVSFNRLEIGYCC